jgi:hypothetical protein
VGICYLVDCFCGGYDCDKVSSNWVFYGLVGVYFPAWYISHWHCISTFLFFFLEDGFVVLFVGTFRETVPDLLSCKLNPLRILTGSNSLPVLPLQFPPRFHRKYLPPLTRYHIPLLLLLISCKSFTLGTFALLCNELGSELQQQFFSILGTIITICVILLWNLVAFRTTIEGWKGKIFYAPCLASVGDKVPEPIEMTVTPEVRGGRRDQGGKEEQGAVEATGAGESAVNGKLGDGD